jgi:Fe/S biogenesis protein NfuA
MSVKPTDHEPILRITDAARKKILEIRSSEPNPEQLALGLEVTGVADGNYTYDMYFEALADAGAQHTIERSDDLSVIVSNSSVDKLRGSTLDLSSDLMAAGSMVIQNPNRPEPVRATPNMAAPPADLSGDVAQRVAQVLDHQINPSIAAHGGRADLVAVQDNTAYLRLSGGCAGCGMAAVTLSQGIEVAIFASVPEITRVVDVTDHASGTNPYYEAAKK